MSYAIIYHHEHAYDNQSMEAIIGPFAEIDAAKEGMKRIEEALNKGRDQVENGHWVCSDDCLYLGMDEEHVDNDISSEFWAEVVEMKDPTTYLK